METMERKQHSAQFEARVALEVVRGYKTEKQLASEYRDIIPGPVSGPARCGTSKSLDNYPEAEDDLEQ